MQVMATVPPWRSNPLPQFPGVFVMVARLVSSPFSSLPESSYTVLPDTRSKPKYTTVSVPSANVGTNNGSGYGFSETPIIKRNRKTISSVGERTLKLAKAPKPCQGLSIRMQLWMFRYWKTIYFCFYVLTSQLNVWFDQQRLTYFFSCRL